MKSDFTLAFNEIVEARALPKEKVLEALSQALVSAYRRDAKVIDAQRVVADIDPTGAPRLLVEKEVVDGDIHNPQTEVALHEARKVDPTAKEGDLIFVPVQSVSKSFGRIAAQTAKQVILQHIREAEREALYEEYIERQDDIITATVQSVSASAITLDLGRAGAEAIMPQKEKMPTERYRPHEKIRVYVVEVKKSNRGPQIIVSRNHRNMLRRLLEYEVPEIYNGQIEVKAIAREAGYRSKVAVAALQEGIDAVGACVGMRGMRIQNIVKELNDEKIDIIEWDSDSARYIARALSPARVTRVFLEEEIDSVRTATVIVPEDQLSLAIGREGQNARLAAKLTGWRIDIKSVIEAAQAALERIDYAPLRTMKRTHPELVTEANRILEKKAANRAVTPEEYASLTKFVEVAETLQYEGREERRKERRDALNAVRPLVPPTAFAIPLEELELADDIMQVIGRMENVGELWLRFLADEDGLEVMLKEGGAGPDAMDAIRDALDDLAVPQVAQLETSETEPEPEASLPLEALTVEAAPAPVAPSGEAEAQPAPAAQAEPEAAAPVARVKNAPTQDEEPEPDMPPEYELYMDDLDEEGDDSESDGDDATAKSGKGKKGKKGKNRRRQLVFDEDLGEVVAKRRRKRSGEDGYDEFY